MGGFSRTWKPAGTPHTNKGLPATDMEANRISAPRQGWLRTVVDRFYALAGLKGIAGDPPMPGDANAPIAAHARNAVVSPDAADDKAAAPLVPPSPPAAEPDYADAVSRSFENTAAAVDFLVHVDARLHFLYVSDASLRFAGYHREFLLGATLADIVTPEHHERLEALIARASHSGAVEKDTIDLVKALTYPLPVELRVQRAQYGETAGFAVAGFDDLRGGRGAAQASARPLRTRSKASSGISTTVISARASSRASV